MNAYQRATTSVLWGLVGLIVAVLLLIAGTLIFRMRLFSTEPLADVQLKTLWAFVGVALGAAATLIGALLADQNNRRLAAQALEAVARADAVKQRELILSEESGRRQTLEVMTKVLELITEGAEYAPRAKVSGAIATLMQLEGGPISVRLLNELWNSERLDTSMATWLLERVLMNRNSDPSEQNEVCFVLATNAHRLLPAASDLNQNWTAFPKILKDGWPKHLGTGARWSLVCFCVRYMASREWQFWVEGGDLIPPIEALVAAVDDPDNGAEAAAAVLKIEASGILTEIGFDLSDVHQSLRDALQTRRHTTTWYDRLISSFERQETWGTNS